MKITLRDNKINLNAQYHFKPQLNSMLSLILLINSVLLLGFKPSDQNSVQFSHSVVSDSLRPHELQYARPPCPSSTPRVYPNSCPLSWWYHQIISSSVVPFSSCPHFPSIRVFSNESALCIRWPKYLSFSFNISPSSEHPGLISFRMDWLDFYQLFYCFIVIVTENKY